MSVITDVGFKVSRGAKIGVIESGATQKSFFFFEEDLLLTFMQALGSSGAFQKEGQHGIVETQQFSSLEYKFGEGR